MSLAVRIIPCLDVRDGRVVKGINFKDIVDAGDPAEAAKRYDAEGADEICMLDIDASFEDRSTTIETVKSIASQVFIPFTVGGGIKCPTIAAGFGKFGSVAAPFKFFDIPHPSKEFPHRLRYSCLEGPEIGVYVRGVLQGTNEIELPDYWKDLVDEDTITVQLTPIGSHQSLCYAVAKMKDKISILVNPHGFNSHTIRCSYIVYAERKDVKKLVTEYEGATE